MKFYLIVFILMIGCGAALAQQWVSRIKAKLDTVYIKHDTAKRLVLSWDERIRYNRASYRVSADSCYVITECDKTKIVTIYGNREIPYKFILYIK